MANDPYDPHKKGIKKSFDGVFVSYMLNNSRAE
jgi:hypothetical protein